jgi:GNAT superfamily N-acetyltransferase
MTLLGSSDRPRRSYTLRLATANEVSVLAHHRASMFRDMEEVDEQGAVVIANASVAQLVTLIEAREYFGFLAEYEGQVVGGGGVWLRPLLPQPGTRRACMEAYVLNVFTEPNHRRVGVARALMEAIIEWGQSQGVVRIVLHASKDGRPLYESLGFEASNEMRLKLDRP